MSNFCRAFGVHEFMKTRFLAVYLVRLDTRAGRSHEMRKKSGQKASEKVAKMVVNRRGGAQHGVQLYLGARHRLVLT